MKVDTKMRELILFASPDWQKGQGKLFVLEAVLVPHDNCTVLCTELLLSKYRVPLLSLLGSCLYRAEATARPSWSVRVRASSLLNLVHPWAAL